MKIFFENSICQYKIFCLREINFFRDLYVIFGVINNCNWCERCFVISLDCIEYGLYYYDYRICKYYDV